VMSASEAKQTLQFEGGMSAAGPNRSFHQSSLFSV
jgi:hypothetical protein